MSRANILAQIANPQGGESIMRAYQQGTQMRYMQNERDRMHRKENALFSLAPMIEAGDFKGAAAAAARGGDPHLSQGFITLAQKQERDNSFNNLLNPGGGGAGGVPPVSGGEPMPIVRPSMGAGSDAGSAAPQGQGQQFTPAQIAEAQSRWAMDDESGAMNALYPKAPDLSESERAFTDPAFKQHLIDLRKAGATTIKIGEGQKEASVLMRTTQPAWEALTKTWDALADEQSRVGKVIEERGAGWIGRQLQSPKFQVAYNAAQTLIMNHSLATSGKTMSAYEIQAKIDTILPKVGDPTEVTAEKKLLIHGMMDAIRRAAEGDYSVDEGNTESDPTSEIDALVEQYGGDQ